MFKWLNDLFNRPDPLDELRAEIQEIRTTSEKTARMERERLEQEKAEIEKQLTESNEELATFRKKQEADDARRNSKEPWVEIRGIDHNDVKGLRIELDWNDAFIEHLKDNGIKGGDEDEIVQKWLAMMYQHLVERLEEKVVDNKDQRGTIRDYA